jgi:hypothetical protein
MKTESQIIADIFDNGRRLSHFFLGKLQGVDVLKEIEVNGQKLNSILWIVAHMTWAEEALMLKAMGHKGSGIAWLDEFKIGGSGNDKSNWPSFEEVTRGAAEVHKLTMEFVPALTPEQLDEKIFFKLFNSERARRDVLYHAIRHDSNHTGHLSWLCKLNGIKTV